MRGVRQFLIFAVVPGIWLLALGFVIFAAVVTREPAFIDEPADGIVVLTGGPLRIKTGAELLERGLGKRLLISGVNVRTGQADVKRISGLTAKQFQCCVDLGYEARDTIGNAFETRNWAESRKYTSLIVVTSNVHMPRSLAEFARALPSTKLIPYPVTAGTTPAETWWLHPPTARNLIAEYLKFLPSAARLAVQRVISPFESGSFAAVDSQPAPRT